MTASSASRVSIARSAVGVREVRRRGRSPRCRGLQPGLLVRADQPFGHCRVDHSRSVPPHAEVALDGARAPHHLDDLATQDGVLALWRHDRIDVGGRPSDVDDQHVADPLDACGAVGEHLDTRQHRVGRRGPHESREVGARRETLAADHVTDEDLADRLASRLGVEPPDDRQHVGGGVDGLPAVAQQRRDLVTDVDVAGGDDGHPQLARGQRCRVVQQDLGVAAIGAADQQHDVWLVVQQLAHPTDVERPTGDVRHACTGGQTHAVPGLGGDDALVAHHGRAAARRPRSSRRASPRRAPPPARRGRRRCPP